jgi:gamma-glutamyltranspeptidase/glutathione hydrolase
MVVSAHRLASEVGARVLAEGGTAVDAAIATGFALAVTHPVAGNIGGGGFMVVRFPDGRTTAFDFREKAPMAAHPRMFLDEAGEYSAEIHHRSHVAVGVPGTVAGFALAHERLGTLPWADLVRPSVGIAKEGFEVTPGLARSLEGGLGSMAPYPASVAAFSKDGRPYQAGEILIQTDLAGTLERIMGLGRDGFYRGKTARLLAEEMRREGGLITEEDLAAYRAVERDPVRGRFRGYDIITMPPPSSGGVALVQMLNILEGYDLASLGHNSAETIHFLVEAMRRAYRDRALYLGDPDFVTVPVERLTDKAYAAALREDILPARASVSAISDIALPEESPETTHYSVVDASGMAVSVTYTLEAGYGSKIVVPGAGFLLNNEMGDFNAEPGRTTETGLIGTDANLAMPEKRMLSSMTPSIVAKDGDLVAVVGSPGGRTIINTVLQVILNMAEFGMPVDEAVAAGRLHHQWLPDRVRIEAGAIDEETRQALEAMGYEISEVRTQGRAHSIMIDPATGERVGAPDPRDADGGAAGHDG